MCLRSDNAYACDPRIARFKSEEKERKQAEKRARQEAFRQKADEEEKVWVSANHWLNGKGGYTCSIFMVFEKRCWKFASFKVCIFYHDLLLCNFSSRMCTFTIFRRELMHLCITLNGSTFSHGFVYHVFTFDSKFYAFFCTLHYKKVHMVRKWVYALFMCLLLRTVYCASGQLSLLSSVGWYMSNSSSAVEWRPGVADRSCGMSAGCTTGSVVHWCKQ